MKIHQFLLASAMITVLSPASANPSKTPTPSPAKTKAVKSQEPITLEFGNMKSETPRLIKLARHLKSSEATKSTAAYAGQYFEMLQLVTRIGINNLTQDEVKTVRAVSEPTDEAIAVYKRDRQQSQQTVSQQAEQIDMATAQKQQQKAQEASVQQQLQAQQAARQTQILIQPQTGEVTTETVQQQ